jgi:arylsulfatase A-like enzyme
VKRGITAPAPAGNADVTPTVLALLGLDGEAGLDGRVVAEALEGGPDPEQVAVETRIHTAAAGAYRAALQISTVDGRRYVDKSWRIS